MEKTVKVRIAVAVDPEGNWGCAGWKNADQDELHSYAVENLENGEHRYWLDAELKIPEIPEISATVSSATGDPTPTEAGHPVTPPPELVKQWWDGTHGAYYEFEAITIQAARWGANQELEACCEWLRDNGLYETRIGHLRSARRPKPLSQAEEALAVVDKISKCGYPGNMQDDSDYDVIRNALKRLQELEGK